MFCFTITHRIRGYTRPNLGIAQSPLGLSGCIHKLEEQRCIQGLVEDAKTRALRKLYGKRYWLMKSLQGYEVRLLVVAMEINLDLLPNIAQHIMGHLKR